MSPRTPKSADRTCCDGLCQQGQPCPQLRPARTHVLRLAPGVIDGPHKPGAPRIVTWVRRLAGRVQP